MKHIGKVITGILFAGLLGVLAGPAEAQKKDQTYPRGRKAAPETVTKARHQASAFRNGDRVKKLPKATASKFDVRESGGSIPAQNQGNCGSCWDFSGCEVVTNAIIKAGQGTVPHDGSFFVSPQYVLDCVPSGGCDGDDNVTVLAAAKNKGIPASSDYGPYAGGQQRCKNTSGMRFYKIVDWGYCTPSQQDGIAATQDIKNCLVAYGALGTAVAAGNDWDSYQAGGILRANNRDVNHDVVFLGWDDEKGAWLVMNSWGPGWGDKGTCYIKYGAEQIGTEAVWATATALAPVPPGPAPDPVPVPNPLPPQPVPVPPPYVPVPFPPQPQPQPWCGPVRRILGRCDGPGLFHRRQVSYYETQGGYTFTQNSFTQGGFATGTFTQGGNCASGSCPIR